MKLNTLNRRVHYWATVFIALPIVVVISSGILLQLKKQWSWVQPTEQKGAGKVPKITPDLLLQQVQSLPEFGSLDWANIKRVDCRPAKGMTKISLDNGWEIQIDNESAAVLQVAYRRSDLIESLHDGSFFGGNLTKLGIFLPSGIGLLLMWLTGLWMFWLPISVKMKKKRASNKTDFTIG